MTKTLENLKLHQKMVLFSTYTIKLWQTEMPLVYDFETLSSDAPYHKFWKINLLKILSVD